MSLIKQMWALFAAFLLSAATISTYAHAADGCATGKGKRTKYTENGVVSYCKSSACHTIPTVAGPAPNCGAIKGWSTVTGNFPAVTVSYFALETVSGTAPANVCNEGPATPPWDSPCP